MFSSSWKSHDSSFWRLSLCQAVSEREADIKRLQEQLTEANQAREATPGTQVSQSKSSPSGETDQAAQEELNKLRQEVLPYYMIYFNLYEHEFIWNLQKNVLNAKNQLCL